MTTTLNAQEYMVIDNHYGQFARYDIELIKQVHFKKYDSSGTGTEADPYNVAAANAKCKEYGEQFSTERFFVKGIIASSNNSFNSNGSINLYIADDSIGINRITVYLSGKDGGMIPSNINLKRGNEIIVCGFLYSLNITTHVIEGYIVSINGEKIEYESNPIGSGTSTDPFNVAGIIKATTNLSSNAYFNDGEDVYVTGLVTSINNISPTYGNATYFISDDAKGYSNSLYVYRGKMLNDAAVITETDLQVGDSVTICGKIKNYNGTILEFDQGNYLVFHKKANGETPTGGDSGDGNASYSVDFKANGLSDWTIDNKTLPTGLTEIWKHDTKYGMVAKAFASNTNYDSEAWLISPAIDLSAASSATLKIHQAINFFTSVDVAKTQAAVMISEDGTNWTELTLSGWPTTLSWTFFDSTADLSAFAGKSNIKLALKYTSTAEKAGTWEVETITIE